MCSDILDPIPAAKITQCVDMFLDGGSQLGRVVNLFSCSERGGSLGF